MKNKVKVGDLYLVIGPAHVEKTEVSSIQDNTFKLKNNIILDKKSINPLNSKMMVSVFDETLYELLLAKQSLSKLADELKQLILEKQIPDDKVIKVRNKINKILNYIKNE